MKKSPPPLPPPPPGTTPSQARAWEKSQQQASDSTSSSSSSSSSPVAPPGRNEAPHEELRADSLQTVESATYGGDDGDEEQDRFDGDDDANGLRKRLPKLPPLPTRRDSSFAHLSKKSVSQFGGGANLSAIDEREDAVQFCAAEWDANSWQSDNELTARSLIVGAVLGIIFGTQNIYFGIRSGTSFGGSIVVSLVGYGVVRALLRLWPGQKPFTIQENVILEAAASAGQGMIFTGGFSTYILAMSSGVQLVNPRLGTATLDVSYGQALVWLLTTIYLGLFSAIPMRRLLVVERDLPWPTARAATVVMRGLHTAEGNREATLMLTFLSRVTGLSILWYAFKWLFSGQGQMEAWPLFGAVAARYGWTMDWSTAYVGSGMLMPAQSAWSLLAGALTFFALVEPWADANGCWGGGKVDVASLGAPHTTPEGTLVHAPLHTTECNPGFDGLKAYYFLPPLCITLVDSFYQIGKLALQVWLGRAIGQGAPDRDESDIEESPMASLQERMMSPHAQHAAHSHGRTASSSTGRASDAAGSRQVPPGADEPEHAALDPRVWYVGFGINALVAAIVLPLYFGLRWYMVILCLALGPIIGYGVNLGAAMTDISLVSAIGKFIIICFAGTTASGESGVLEILWLAGVGMVAVGASNDLLTDYKAAHLTGTSSRSMFKAQVFGALTAALVVPLTYTAFIKAFPIAESGDFTAPGAVALRALAAIFTEGFAILPPYVGYVVLYFGILTLLNNLAHDVLPERWTQYLPSSIAFAIGGYVAPSFGVNPVIGYIIGAWWRRRDPQACQRYLPALGAGLIAGEGLAATLTALASVVGLKPPAAMGVRFGP